MQEKNKTVSTHKPLNLNCSVKTPKSLMCGSFNVQPTKRNNYSLVVGDNYEKRIQTLQSKEVQLYSVFGSPNQKIGDFVQSKLSGWSN